MLIVGSMVSLDLRFPWAAPRALVGASWLLHMSPQWREGLPDQYWRRYTLGGFEMLCTVLKGRTVSCWSIAQVPLPIRELVECDNALRRETADNISIAKP